ncbi:hypothetical protein DT076_10180 [Desertihabitans brevis]|uniref:Uncharacterized protein n=1 Tax=Desertihabitans brevis TaxID=2268447 RepID=A0A367YVE9_9ACTN|nr:hypothetical protein [Desertihabitans brevis]RCK69788.1 hypothetical protein DT076_10180 [Desertihabitans brevis]
MTRSAEEEVAMDEVDRRSQEPTGDDAPIGRLPQDLADRLRDRDTTAEAGEQSRIEQVDDAIADALGDDPADDS